MNLRERKDCLLFSKTSGRICTVKRDDERIIQEEESHRNPNRKGLSTSWERDKEKNKRIQQEKRWKTVIKAGAIMRGVGAEELFFLRKEVLNTKVFIAATGSVSSYESERLLQRTWVWFPAHIWGRSQLLVIPAPGVLKPSSGPGNPTHMHILTHRHIHVKKNKANLF